MKKASAKTPIILAKTPLDFEFDYALASVIEKFFKVFQSSREHWLFWPFVLLIIQIGLYNFLFSENGYLAYLEKTKEKEKLKAQIEELNLKKSELTKKLSHIKNESELIKDFIQKLYRYDDKYIIVKFIDDQKTKKEVKEDKVDLVTIQRIYISISTFILLFFTGYCWKKQKQREPNEA